MPVGVRGTQNLASSLQCSGIHRCNLSAPARELQRPIDYLDSGERILFCPKYPKCNMDVSRLTCESFGPVQRIGGLNINDVEKNVDPALEFKVAELIRLRRLQRQRCAERFSGDEDVLSYHRSQRAVAGSGSRA
jgi:hypothetical protein